MVSAGAKPDFRQDLRLGGRTHKRKRIRIRRKHYIGGFGVSTDPAHGVAHVADHSEDPPSTQQDSAGLKQVHIWRRRSFGGLRLGVACSQTFTPLADSFEVPSPPSQSSPGQKHTRIVRRWHIHPCRARVTGLDVLLMGLICGVLVLGIWILALLAEQCEVAANLIGVVFVLAYLLWSESGDQRH